MKKSLFAAAALLIVLCLAFVGCSGGSMSESPAADHGWPDYYDKTESFNGAPAESVSDNEPGAPVSANMPVNRKVIRNAELRVETLEFDDMMSALMNKVNLLGGYVQSNSVSGRSYGSFNDLRSAKTVVRIPADKLDEFLSAVNGLGNVISSSEQVEDVTDSYVDTEARLASLRTEYQTLLDLLAEAEDLEDIITLQDRLSDVRYQIESYEARIRSYDSLIAYSTVSMTINEVERETAVEEESFGDEVSRRFKESLEDVGDGFRDFASWFIGNLPMILVLLVFFVGLPLMIVLICVKSAKKRRAKRAAKAAEAAQNK